MQLTDLERVVQLSSELQQAEGVLADFMACKDPTVKVYASARGGDYGRGSRMELPAVETGVAVAAAKRVREGIASQLRDLGVKVP